MLRTLVFVSITLHASMALAASSLGDWDQVSGDLVQAANRAGVSPPANSMQCIGDYPSSCRWDAGDGVDVLANTDGAGHLMRIEAGWNNARPASGPASAATYRSLCSTIAAIAVRSWGKAEVARAVAKTMSIGPSPKDSVDREQSIAGVKLYGSRNTPDRQLRSRPDEAFLQCGAMVD